MNHKTYDLVYVSMFAILLAICSWLSIPTMVPFTLQTFGIFFTLLMLGGKQGTSVILLYLLLGSIGLPVFSNFGAGIGYLLGNTGGYTLGFLATGLMFWLFEIIFPRKALMQVIALLLGLILCYLFGTFWILNLSISSGNILGFRAVFSMCVLPFIVPDLCKLWLAYLLSKRFRNLLHKTY